MVYVSRDQVEAMTMADRIVVLNQGRMEQIGTPLELYRRPVNLFVAAFIGSPKMNFLPIETVGSGDGATTVALPGGGRLDVPVVGVGAKTLGFRPEHIAVPEPGAPVTADATVTAEVLVVEHLGSDTLLHLALPGGATVDAEGSGELEIDPGTKIEIGLIGERCHLFNSDGQAIGR